MHQSMNRIPHRIPGFGALDLARNQIRLLAGAVFTALCSISTGAHAQSLDVNELNTALKQSLTTGRDAGKNLACTATMVFFDSTFMKFVFGGMILIAVCMAAFAWYQQNTRGVSVGRVFIMIIVFMVVVALIGVLTTSFMNCG